MGKRSVRFAEEKNQVRIIERLINPDDIWTTKEEYETSRIASNLVMKDQQRNIILINAALQLHSHCKRQATNKRTNAAVSPKIIAELATCSDDVRGLEAFIVRPIHIERLQQRNTLRDSVLQMQRTIKKEGYTLDHSSRILARI